MNRTNYSVVRRAYGNCTELLYLHEGPIKSQRLGQYDTRTKTTITEITVILRDPISFRDYTVNLLNIIYIVVVTNERSFEKRTYECKLIWNLPARFEDFWKLQLGRSLIT